MHPSLVKFIGDSSPDLNMDLALGLPRIHMRDTVQFVRKVIESAIKSAPPCFVFDDIRKADPVENYYGSLKGRPKHRKTSRGKEKNAIKTSGTKTYDTSRTNFFLTYLQFSHIDQETGVRTALEPRPLFLPFVGQAASLFISDTRWFISPVLTDRVISIGPEHIFVRLLRDKLTFSREYFEIKVDGQPRRNDLVYSRIYHNKDKDKSAVNAPRTTMAHYLFCKYGFEGAMQKYAGTTPIVGEELDKKLDPEEWVIYSSMGMPPRSMHARTLIANKWFAPKIQVAVKRSEVNATSQTLITGLFYVATHHPHQIIPEYVNSPEGWVAPLGYMIYSDKNNRGTIEEMVYKHLSSLDDYADPIVIASMASIDINIDNIYDFFAIIASKFSGWIANGQSKVASMYDKELSTLYFVLFDVIKAIFNLHFALKGSSKKNLSIADLEKALKEHIKPGMCFQIAKNHGEASSVSSCGDNMAFKATATLTPQTNTSKQGKKSTDRAAANDPSKRMHPSVAEAAAMTCMNKSDPSGRSRTNHYLLLDETRSFIVRNPKFARRQEVIARNELATRPVTEFDMIDEISPDEIPDD